MLRSSANCRVIALTPSALLEVICDRPGISENCRSSGCATDDAMVSGLAPGKLAETWMVGKSTWGSGETGSRPQARIPLRARPTVSKVVATGRLMKGAEMFMPDQPDRAGSAARAGQRRGR